MSWGSNTSAGRSGIPTDTAGDQNVYYYYYHPHRGYYQGCGAGLKGEDIGDYVEEGTVEGFSSSRPTTTQWIPAVPGGNHGLVGTGLSYGRSTTSTPYADVCPSPGVDNHHYHNHHLVQKPGYDNHRLEYVGASSARPCRLKKRLQSMAYGVMLCTFLWIFLYTLSFSCCVGNSRLEAGAQEDYGGDENSVVIRAAGGDDGGTRRLYPDYQNRRRSLTLISQGRVHDPNEVQAKMVATRRLEEDEDDTIYTLPDENDPSPAWSTQGDGGHDRYLFNRPDPGDRRHRQPALNTRPDKVDFRSRASKDNQIYSNSNNDNNINNINSRHGKRADSTGDNTLNLLKSDNSDNSSSKNRKYDTRRPARRRGRGSKFRGPDPETWARQGYSRKLPNSLIIGVKKGGTRALLEFLRVHPDIRAPGPEPHFFDRNYDKGLDWYRNQMPPTLASQLTMEKTPSYFVTKGVPARIFNMSRDIKLIIVVRDPVTRAISDYTQSSSKRTDVKAFEEMAFLDNITGLVDTSWGAVRIGVYAKHLERWLRYFPLTQMHFVSGERLISDPAAELAKVQDFLGLKRVITDKHFYFNSTKGFPCLKKPEGSGNPHCLGKTKGRPHPKVDPKVIKRLHDFYRPFNAKFYQMTSIDFNWH